MDEWVSKLFVAGWQLAFLQKWRSWWLICLSLFRTSLLKLQSSFLESWNFLPMFDTRPFDRSFNIQCTGVERPINMNRMRHSSGSCWPYFARPSKKAKSCWTAESKAKKTHDTAPTNKANQRLSKSFCLRLLRLSSHRSGKRTINNNQSQQAQPLRTIA